MTYKFTTLLPYYRMDADETGQDALDDYAASFETARTDGQTDKGKPAWLTGGQHRKGKLEGVLR